MSPPVILIWLLCGVVMLILGWLRWTKGRLVISQGEQVDLPSSPGMQGIVIRLDGIDRKNRTIQNARLPKSMDDGALALPTRWSDGRMNAARLAAISHTWAMAKMAENDLPGHKQRERAVARARVLPILVFFVCVILMAAGRMSFPIALSIALITWTMSAVVSIPSQYREWKAVAIAKEGLKKAGLYPQMRPDARILDTCIAALAWCRVAGFGQVIPK